MRLVLERRRFVVWLLDGRLTRLIRMRRMFREWVIVHMKSIALGILDYVCDYGDYGSDYDFTTLTTVRAGLRCDVVFTITCV